MPSFKETFNMSKFFTLDNLYKVGSTIGMIAILYLNLNYVSVTKFDEHVRTDIETHTKITETLYNISTAIALIQHSELILSDHEARIRILERKLPQ